MNAGAESARLVPRDAADVAAIVAAAEQPLELVGGGSKRQIGKPVDAQVIDLGALTGIVTYEPEELVLTARAATPLAAIEDALATHAQRLAFEPPHYTRLLDEPRGQTIGGVLAANLAGSRRVTAGAARDHFLGFRAVTGRGEPFKAGGKVVKNVTGYDLPKLLAGSWGTLAVLTEVTIRVAPAPELDRTLAFAAGSIGECLALSASALRSSHDVSAAGVDPARGALIRLEGFAPSVDARTRALCDELRSEPQQVLQGRASRACWHALASADALAASPVVWRISVPPADAAGVLERLATDRYVVDWGGGLLYAAFDAVDAPRVRGALTTGHATLLKAPLAARSAVPVFQPQAPAVAAAAARLRNAFDPRGILNPGRMG
jgi:glycolate oxidase FAD binding subunit